MEWKGGIGANIFFLPCESEVGVSNSSRLRLLQEQVVTPDCCASCCRTWERLKLVVGALLDPLEGCLRQSLLTMGKVGDKLEEG